VCEKSSLEGFRNISGTEIFGIFIAELNIKAFYADISNKAFTEVLMATHSVSNAARSFYETGALVTDRFYSVEFQVEKSEIAYQFKIWKIPAAPNFVLVKEGSDIINWIHPGDIFSMTYYSDDFSKPRQQFPTQILNILRQDVGRFRGHYMVTLGIIEN
jgi:hypothetical protein